MTPERGWQPPPEPEINHRRLARWLPGLVTGTMAALLVMVALNIAGNKHSIVRSCEILNAAIVQSQKSQGNEPTRILIGAILDGKPRVRAAYLEALKHSKPVLAPIDCSRVTDSDYKPYAR